MSYIFTDVQFFPSTKNATLPILDESTLPTDMREYCRCQPSKGRITTNWVWNAPEKLKRLPEEPGYAMAYSDLGMGHWNILYWNHTTDKWHLRLMGGSNGHSATKKYEELLSNGFEAPGLDGSIAEWMTKFQSES